MFSGKIKEGKWSKYKKDCPTLFPEGMYHNYQSFCFHFMQQYLR